MRVQSTLINLKAVLFHPLFSYIYIFCTFISIYLFISLVYGNEGTKYFNKLKSCFISSLISLYLYILYIYFYIFVYIPRYTSLIRFMEDSKNDININDLQHIIVSLTRPSPCFWNKEAVHIYCFNSWLCTDLFCSFALPGTVDLNELQWSICFVYNNNVDILGSVWDGSCANI